MPKTVTTPVGSGTGITVPVASDPYDLNVDLEKMAGEVLAVINLKTGAVAALPPGGSAGQVLTRTASGYAWSALPSQAAALLMPNPVSHALAATVPVAATAETDASATLAGTVRIANPSATHHLLVRVELEGWAYLVPNADGDSSTAIYAVPYVVSGATQLLRHMIRHDRPQNGGSSSYKSFVAWVDANIAPGGAGVFGAKAWAHSSVRTREIRYADLRVHGRGFTAAASSMASANTHSGDFPVTSEA